MVRRFFVRHRLPLLAIGILVAACAVRHAGPDGITIEHDSKQPELAAIEAERHCAKYADGASGVVVTSTAFLPSLFYLSSSLSAFNCAPK